jgi:hypothetical protein
VPYWMMRLFLADRMAGTLFAGGARPLRVTRETYLRQVLSSEIRFTHRKRMYVYTPFQNATRHILSGVIARERQVTIAKPPEEKYQKESIPDWDTSNVFIDISGEDDGQKVAMQDAPLIGGPLVVFRSLADHINATDRNSDWLIAVNTITSDADFWKIMAENRGYISEVDLVLAAPNIWNGMSETEKALKELDMKNGVKETEIRLKNPDKKLNPGLPDDNGFIATAINYIRRGGGRYKAKRGRFTIFNSEEHVIKSTPPVDKPIQEAETAAVLALAQWLMSRQ